MIHPPKIALCVIALLAAPACHHANTSQGSAGYAGAPIAPAQWTASCAGPAVFRAGTRINIQLNEAIRLSTSYPGQHFTAVVATPLVDRSGCAVVPRGALIEGSVAAVTLGATSTVRLTFDRIDTALGTKPLLATLDRDVHFGTTVALAPTRNERLGYDAVVAGHRPIEAIGGGPRGVPVSEAPELPVGSQLTLILSAPLRVE